MSNTSAAGWARALGCAAAAAALLQGAALADAPSAPQLASASALPGATPPAATASLVSSDQPAFARRKHILGLQLDAGVPDVTAVSVLYRPLKYVRLSGGMLYNLASYGLRGGVSVQPYFPIAPSLTLEVGHYFDGNAYDKLSKYTSIDENLRPYLQKVGYTFVNAQLGLELGHPDWFVFFVRAGISRVWTSIHNANDATKSASAGDGGLKPTFIGDPNVRLGIPNVKLGFMIFFY